MVGLEQWFVFFGWEVTDLKSKTELYSNNAHTQNCPFPGITATGYEPLHYKTVLACSGCHKIADWVA